MIIREINNIPIGPNPGSITKANRVLPYKIANYIISENKKYMISKNGFLLNIVVSGLIK